MNLPLLTFHKRTVRSLLQVTIVCPSGTERCTADRSSMPVEGLLVFARDSIPQTDGIVSTCGGKHSPISTEGYVIDTFFDAL